MQTTRPATTTDIPVILGFIHELAAYEKLTHEVTITPEQLHAALFSARPYAEALIAEVDGVPAGYALFFYNFSTFVGKPGIYLEDLYVQPAHRGKGLGKKLLVRVAQLAVERGCGRYEWSVLDWNKPSIDFYEGLGAKMNPAWRLMRVTGPALDTMSKLCE